MSTTLEHTDPPIRVRNYRESDETAWVRTRVLAFLDTSYRDDVQIYRERYDNPTVRLVAEDTSTHQLVGLMDIEYENKPGEVCNFTGERGGIIWHLAVLPEYRNVGIAQKLWEEALGQLERAGIHRLQVWTQDDEPANHWYVARGFELKHSYLNVFARGFIDKGPLNELLVGADKTWEFGHIRNLNFEADSSQRERLEALSYRIHEVRGYELDLKKVLPSS